MQYDNLLPLVSSELTDKIPAWAKQNAWTSFLSRGIPNRRDEFFKQADFSFLLNKKFTAPDAHYPLDLEHAIKKHRLAESICFVFINGYFIAKLSNLNELPSPVIACNWQEGFSQHERLIKNFWPDSVDVNRYPFAILNQACFTQGLFFYLPEKTKLEKTVHLLFYTTGDDSIITYPRHLFILNKASQLTLVEEYRTLFAGEASYVINNLIHIVAKEESYLHHYKIQKEAFNAMHLAHTFIKQEKNSFVNRVQFSHGAQFSRDEIKVVLEDKEAHCRLNGFYHLNHPSQYSDHQLEIEHKAPYSASNMYYKGILDGKSTGVFNGRVHVAPIAKHTTAYQTNQHIHLSDDAQSYAKPDLEIYTDEIKCKHAATTGQLNRDAIFYLRARGISEQDAKVLLLEGFAEDIIKQISHPAIQQKVIQTYHDRNTN